jgi:hypothetical protein
METLIKLLGLVLGIADLIAAAMAIAPYLVNLVWGLFERRAGTALAG